MKILVVSNLYKPHEVGGYEINCHDFNILLKELGHQIKILTSKIKNDKIVDKSVCRYFKISENFGTDKKVFNYKYCNQYNSNIFNQQLKSFQPDLILLWNIKGLGTDIINDLIISNINFRIFVFDYSYFYYKKTLKDFFFFRYKEKITKKNYNKIQSKFLFTSKFLASFYGIRPNFSNIIYPYVNFKKILYKKNFSKYRNKLLYLGQIVDHKGIYEIIEFINNYNKKYKKNKLKLSIFTKYLSQQNKVFFKKYNFIKIYLNMKRANIIKKISKFDIGLLPSKWNEPLGNAGLEMLASGLIVLSTLKGGIKDLRINLNPIKIDLNNQNKFNRVIIDIQKKLIKPSSWRKLGVKKFQKKTIKKKLVKLLNKVNLENIYNKKPDFNFL